MVIQQIKYPSDFEAKKIMIETGRRMAEKSFVIAGEGTMSVRVGPNAVWFCAEDADKGCLKQDNFVRVDMNGRPMPVSRNARVPVDAAAHLRLYGQNPALRAVIHAYPPGAVALAARREGVEPADYTPAVRKLGRLKLASGHDAADAAVLSCKTDGGILIAGDGCMVWGESLTEAFHRLETVEYYAKLRRLLCACETPQASPAASVREKPRPVFSGMEGLTGIIRPGDAAPVPTAVEPAPVRPVASAAAQAASRPVGNRPAAPAAKPVVRPEEQARSAKRQEMMAEVVRRSLGDM